jgi:hypothetical protein
LRTATDFLDDEDLALRFLLLLAIVASCHHAAT